MKNRSLLLAIVCLLGSEGILAVAATAQSSDAAVRSTSFRGTSASKRETTAAGTAIVGTIDEKLVIAPSNSPRGVHLLLMTHQGVVDASLGPYLASDVKESLAVGLQVTITGATQSFNGQSCFLVHELTIGGRQIAIRNEKGFLIHAPKPAVARVRQNQTVIHSDNP
jgi:hypothetical protein